MHHYSRELVDVLETVGRGDVVLETIFEPSITKAGSRRWLSEYLLALRRLGRARRSGSSIVVTWPVLGFLDIVIIRMIAGPGHSLVLHDTVPLVKSIGYGRIAQAVASLFTSRVQIVVHSERAAGDIKSARLRRHALLLPHPILRPESDDAPTPSRKIVSVLGQYKADRDVAAMEQISSAFGSDIHFRAVGRRWPEVPGWTVRDEFVEEGELDRLIDESSCVVIPYLRFYQSGIAIRSLERSVPVVGPSGTSLDELLGSDSPLLVKNSSDWPRAVESALMTGRADSSRAAEMWRTRCEVEWAAALR